MQPDNNVQNEATTPVMAKPMEAPETAPEMPNMMQGSDKKQTNKGMILGMILLAILAIGGIGFGVWAMMDGNQQKANYDKQITDLKEQNSELLSKLSDADDDDDDDGDVIIDVDTDTSGVDTADYIYVGEWGLKIKIPESLDAVGYDFHTTEYGDHLVVAGVKDGSGGEASYQYTNVEYYYAGSIVRANSDIGVYPYGDVLVFTDEDGNNYYFQGPQADLGSTEEQTAVWKESAEIIKEMLTNPDNYSKI